MGDHTFLEDELRISKSGVRHIFTPSTPIKDEGFLKGRQKEMRQILQTLNTPGQHALLFGDRGVGKSSLANVVSKHLIEGSSLKLIKKRCDSSDTFSSVIEKVLIEAGVDPQIRTISNQREGKASLPLLSGGVGQIVEKDGIQSKIDSPSWVCDQIKDLNVLLVIDEFDAIVSKDQKKKIAELIKQLSDSDSSMKVLIVGIAESSSELTEGHPSVQRCLTEIKLHKMSYDELVQIVKGGAQKLEMTVSKESTLRIVRMSSGYPYFTHLLSLKATERAIVEERKEVTLEDVKVATEKAIVDCENSLKNIYNTVTSYQNNMCKKILYTAALCNEEFIRAKNLRDKYEQIFHEPISQSTINRYLPQLVGPSDKIMKRLINGVYRFSDPRMASYIRIAQYDMEELIETSNS